jgi:hypothetical protein
MKIKGKVDCCRCVLIMKGGDMETNRFCVCPVCGDEHEVCVDRQDGQPDVFWCRCVLENVEPCVEYSKTYEHSCLESKNAVSVDGKFKLI